LIYPEIQKKLANLDIAILVNNVGNYFYIKKIRNFSLKKHNLIEFLVDEISDKIK
jgi:hypothetical protein